MLWQQGLRLAVANMITLAVGLPLIVGIEKWAERLGYLAKDSSGHLRKVEVEMLFGNLALVAAALATAGALILVAGLVERRKSARRSDRHAGRRRDRLCPGFLPCPFADSRDRGPRSPPACSAAHSSRVSREFSFALAVIITPAAVGREVLRLIRAHNETGHAVVTWSLFAPSLLGMACAFFRRFAGAMWWLSRWLERGRWYLFGVYCLLAAAAVFALHCNGY